MNQSSPLLTKTAWLLLALAIGVFTLGRVSMAHSSSTIISPIPSTELVNPF